MSITPSSAQPRLQLLIGGVVCPALLAEVNNNNYFHADTFRTTLVLSDPRLVQAGFGAAYWMADGTGASPVMVTVQVDPGTASTPNWTTLIVGRIDHVEWSPVTAELEITGRDRTADFIESKTFETFKNQTSSQVATTLARRHGMQAQVTATTTLIERYYSQDHDKITLNDFARVTTEWDLLCFLAQQEGFDVFVQGDTLHFQPSTPPGQNPYVVTFDMHSYPFVVTNCITPKISRAFGLARDIMVTVQSWSSKTKSKITVTARATGTRKASAAATAPKGASTTQNYTFTRPNLTHDQAQAFANQKLAELSRHERVVSLSMAGEVALTPRQGLRITGSGTNADIDLYIEEVTRTISAEGFEQTIVAKNSSPKDMVAMG